MAWHVFLPARSSADVLTSKFFLSVRYSLIESKRFKASVSILLVVVAAKNLMSDLYFRYLCFSSFEKMYFCKYVIIS